MNDIQKYLTGTFDGFITEVTSAELKKMPNLIKMWQDFLDFEYGAMVRTEVRDGEVFILDASPNIKNIVGWGPACLAGENLNMILPKPMDEEYMQQIIATVDTIGFCPKKSTILKKDGTTVETIGVIFGDKSSLGKAGYKKYIELVWVKDKIPVYETQRG